MVAAPTASPQGARLRTLVWTGPGLAGLALVLWGLGIGPQTAADTTSYLHALVIRPPGYPVVLRVSQLLGGVGPWAVVVLQGLLAGWSVHRALRSLGPGLGGPVTIGLGVLMALPQLQYVPGLVAESIVYSLWWLWLSVLVDHARAPRPGDWLKLGGLAAIVILFRTDWVFLPGLVGVAGAVLALRDRAWRPLLVAGVAAVLALGGAIGVEAAWHGVVNRSPGRSAFAGVNLAAVQLYLAEPQDLERIGDPDDRAVARAAHAELLRRRLTRSSEPGRTDLPVSFRLVDEPILWEVLIPQQRARLGRDPGPQAHLDTAGWRDLDARSQRIATALLRAHPGRTVRFVYDQVRGFALWPMFLAATAGLAACVAVRRSRRPELVALPVVAAGVLLHHLLIAVSSEFMHRYVFHTLFALAVVLGLVVLRAWPPASDPGLSTAQPKVDAEREPTS